MSTVMFTDDRDPLAGFGPGPTSEDMERPEFRAVWTAIKKWDIQRNPGDGYAGSNGGDVMTILNALDGLAKQVGIATFGEGDVAALYLNDQKVWEGDDMDLGSQLLQHLAIETVRTEVDYWDDGPGAYPDSFARLKQIEEEVTRRVWVGAVDAYHDPVENTYWTESGYQVYQDDPERQEAMDAHRAAISQAAADDAG